MGLGGGLKGCRGLGVRKEVVEALGVCYVDTELLQKSYFITLLALDIWENLEFLQPGQSASMFVTECGSGYGDFFQKDLV